MDQETESVIKFLGGIIATHERLQQLRLHIQRYPEVISAKTCFFRPVPMGYHSDDMSELKTISNAAGVSAEMADGAVADWWLDFWPDERSWHVEYNVYRSDKDEDGSHIAVAFPEKLPTTLDTLFAALSEAVQDLTEVKSLAVTGKVEPERTGPGR